MPFKVVILWTDALVFLLVASGFFFVTWSRRQVQMMMAWNQIKKHRAGMITLVIVLSYVMVGLLDSLHYRAIDSHSDNGKTFYSTQVYSVLDNVIRPIGQHVEKTFSAPFALHSFSKEMVVQSDGKEVQEYPRLLYAGKHLKNESERGWDIVVRSLWAGGVGIIIWLLATTLYFTFRKILGSSKIELKFNKVILTCGVIIIVSSICIHLDKYYYILGTDKVGQDIFYASVKSIRTGLVIGTVTTLVMLPFALLFGTVAGYFGGLIDDIIQYTYTTLSSVPGVLLITASILSLQIFISNHPHWFPTLAERADVRLLSLCIILGITSWTSLCRLLRAETLKLREMDFVRASRAMGVIRSKIIIKHIVPNIMHIVLITMVLDFSGLVLAEAVLSYVGVGVDPTTMSWGNLINSARLDLAREPIVWWPIVSAFVFMFVLVLSVNIFADAVRDAFDPRTNYEK